MTSPSARRRIVHQTAAWTAFLLLSLPACSTWTPTAVTSVDGWLSEKPVASSPAPTSRSTKLAHSSRSSFRLGIDFIHTDPTELNDEFWMQIDETIISPNVRRHWLENGLRIGQWINPGASIHPTAPTEDTGSDPNQRLLDGVGIAGRHRAGHETITLLPSKRHELPIGSALDGHRVVLIRNRGEVFGRRLETPQAVLVLHAASISKAGQASLSLHPEIQHGMSKQRFVSSETAVRIDTGRDAWELPALDLVWTAAPGQSIVIAPAIDVNQTPPTFGLGHQMLRDREHVESTKTIVLVLTWEQLPAIEPTL